MVGYIRYTFFISLFVTSSAWAVPGHQPSSASLRLIGCESQFSEQALEPIVKELEFLDANVEKLSPQRAHELQKLVLDLVASVKNSQNLAVILMKLTDDLLPEKWSRRHDFKNLLRRYLRDPDNKRLALNNLSFVVRDFLSLVQDNKTLSQNNDLDSELKFIIELAQLDPLVFSQAWKSVLNEMTGHRDGKVGLNLDSVNQLILESTRSLIDPHVSTPNEEDHPEGLNEDEGDWAIETQIAEFLEVLHKELRRPVYDASVTKLVQTSPVLSGDVLRKSEAFVTRINHYFLDESDEDITLSGPQLLVFYYRLCKLMEAKLSAHSPKPEILYAMEENWRRWNSLYRDRLSIALKQKYLASIDGRNVDQVAVVNTLAQTSHFKAQLFSGVDLANDLRDPQAWISVESPTQVQHLVEQAVMDSKTKAKFSSRLNEKWGMTYEDIMSDKQYFKFYPDEILDVLIEVSAGKRFPDEAVRDRLRESTKIRYVPRVFSDLSLGRRTGDCTSPGSVNFDRSTTWFYNPHYQMITFSRGGRFLGRMNLALADISERPAILIDALEFNPQTLAGKPYHEEARKALTDVLKFVFKLASSERRDIYALVRSNSSQANDILSTLALKKIGNGHVRFSLNTDYVRRVLRLSANDLITPFYQSFEGVRENGAAIETRHFEDPKLTQLEAEVVNPAQQNDAEIGRWLREARDAANSSVRQNHLKIVAAKLLSDTGIKNKIREIYKIPDGLELSGRFLEIRLDQIFPASSNKNRALSQVLMLPGDVIPIFYFDPRANH